MNKSILLILLALPLIMAKCSSTEQTDSGETTELVTNTTEDTNDASMVSKEKVVAGIDFFEGTWEEALAKAKAENKPLVVDAYADWCRPCKEMERDVFTQRAVGDFYNENFITIRLDIEEGEGLNFSEEYDIMEIPTFLYFNSEGKLIHRTIGKKTVDMFIQDGKDALKS